MIYFIGNEEADICKIGYSSVDNIKFRMKTLQTFCPYPLDFINSIDGNSDQEKELHNHFKDHKLNGEWFKLSKINPFISLKELKAINRSVTRQQIKRTKKRININIQEHIQVAGHKEAARLSMELDKYISFSALIEIALTEIIKKK